MADERARLVSGCAHVGGDAGPALWATRVKGQARLVRKAEQAWAAVALSFLFFLFYLLPIWLGFVITIK